MNQQPLVTPSPFAISAVPVGTAPSPFMQQQQLQQQQPFGGGFGGGGFGFGSASPFGSAAAAVPFTPAAPTGVTAPVAAVRAGTEEVSPMAVQKETKAENYSEGKIYLEAWKHLLTAKKSGCWPFTSIGAGPAAEAVFEGLVLTNEQLHWEFVQRNQQEQSLFLQQLNERLYAVQREFYLKVKEKTAAERLPFEPDSQYESPPAAPPPAFPATAAGFPAAAPAPALSGFGGSFFNSAAPQQQAFGAVSRAVATPAAAAPVGLPAVGAAETGAATNAKEEALQAFHNATFQPGCIPDMPPPPELCG